MLRDPLTLRFAFHELFKSFETLEKERSENRVKQLFGSPGPLTFSKREGSLVKFNRYFSSLPYRDATFKGLKAEIARWQIREGLDEKDFRSLKRSCKKAALFLLDKAFTFYDENLLLFLLKNETTLKRLFKSDLLQKRLIVLFESRQEALLWTAQRYQLRGFDELALAVRKSSELASS